nr:zona pellucida-binding protein, AWN-1=C11 fragment [swine, sperm, Peptide Partial, 9 aa] [Sus scrofa]
DGPPGSEII